MKNQDVRLSYPTFIERIGGRVTSANLFDSFAPSEDDAHHFVRRIRGESQGRGVECYLSAGFLSLLMREELEGPFSINRPDRWVLLTRFDAGRLPGGAYPIFVTKDGVSTKASRVLHDEDAWRFLVQCDLTDDEGLGVARNQLQLLLSRRRSETQLIAALDWLSSLAGLLKSEISEVGAGLPREFRSHADLIRRWAISDDVERGDALSAASRAEMAELLTAGEPLLKSINRHLDALAASKTATPQELERGAMLGAFAEAVAEARLLLL